MVGFFATSDFGKMLYLISKKAKETPVGAEQVRSVEEGGETARDGTLTEDELLEEKRQILNGG